MSSYRYLDLFPKGFGEEICLRKEWSQCNQWTSFWLQLRWLTRHWGWNPTVSFSFLFCVRCLSSEVSFKVIPMLEKSSCPYIFCLWISLLRSSVVFDLWLSVALVARIKFWFLWWKRISIFLKLSFIPQGLFRSQIVILIDFYDFWRVLESFLSSESVWLIKKLHKDLGWIQLSLSYWYYWDIKR